MIKVLDTKYKAIGNLLIIPADNSEVFYVRSPIDFIISKQEKKHTLVLRYTDYESTFDYLSCKMIATLIDYKDCITVLYFNNYLVPDTDFSGSSIGYNFAYKIVYNENDKEDNLFISYQSTNISKNYVT